MGANPEPHDIPCGFHRKRSMVQANPNGPKASNPLEMQRRMPRIFP
jgi:hypothetical protein